MPRAGVAVRNGSERARVRSEGRTWGSTGYLLSHLTAICVVKGLGPSRLVVALRLRPNCRTELFVLRNGLHVVQRPEVAVVDGGGNPIADAELRQHFRLVD